MQNFRRPLLITFFSTNSSTAVYFFVTVILSRLLTPSEVGIFSITVVFIGVLAVFRDFGVSSYIQREKDLTPEKIRSALGLLLTTSWILAAVIYFSSSYVANFYNEPGIENVLHVLTISYALVPFASFFYALLARNLEAEKQAIVNGVSTIAYATTCITLAYHGFSYMSLAWANVANIAVTILVYIYLRPKNTPLIPSYKNWAGPARFGGGAILGNLIDRINSAIPDLLLGKLSGTTAVGLYSRASGLVGIFAQIFGPTINYSSIPMIAKNFHAQMPLGPILFKATCYLTCLSWPFFILTAALSKEIITILYGSQWLSAAPIVIFICAQAFFRVGYSLTQPALMAIGRPYLSAATSGISAIIKLIIVFSFGANDLVMFAFAIAFAEIITTLVAAFISSKYLKYSMKLALRAYWLSMKVNIACLIIVVVMLYSLPSNISDFLKIISVSVPMAFTWLFMIALTNHPILDEIKIFSKRIMPTKANAIFIILVNKIQRNVI